jgi:hypothetical protein
VTSRKKIKSFLTDLDLILIQRSCVTHWQATESAISSFERLKRAQFRIHQLSATNGHLMVEIDRLNCRIADMERG